MSASMDNTNHDKPVESPVIGKDKKESNAREDTHEDAHKHAVIGAGADSRTRKQEAHTRGGFLGSTASSSFRRRAALDRIKVFSKTKTQAEEDRTSCYVLVGGGIRQISPHSKAALQQKQHDNHQESLKEERRVLFANDDNNPSQKVEKKQIHSPNRLRTSAVSSSSGTTTPVRKTTTSAIPSVTVATTVASVSKQRTKEQPSPCTPRTASRQQGNSKIGTNITFHSPNTPKSGTTTRSKIISPSSSSPIASTQKQKRVNSRHHSSLVTPSPVTKKEATSAASTRLHDLSIPVLTATTGETLVGREVQVTRKPMHEVLDDATANRSSVQSPRRPSSLLSSQSTSSFRSPRQKERSKSPATRQPTMPTRTNHAATIVSPKTPVLAANKMLTVKKAAKSSPKGNNWAGVYSYFSVQDDLSEASSLKSKPGSSSSDEEPTPAAIVTPMGSSQEFLVLPMVGEKNDPEAVYGTMASFEKGDGSPPKYKSPGTPSSLDYSSGDESSESSPGPYKMFAAEAQPDDEFWSRASIRAAGPKNDHMATMELIHHARNLIRVYYATLTLQRWRHDVWDSREQSGPSPLLLGVVHEADEAIRHEAALLLQQWWLQYGTQDGQEKFTSREDDQWKDLNLIGAALVLQTWWTRVSQLKQQYPHEDEKQEKPSDTTVGLSEEHRETSKTTNVVRCVSPEAHPARPVVPAKSIDISPVTAAPVLQPMDNTAATITPPLVSARPPTALLTGTPPASHPPLQESAPRTRPPLSSNQGDDSLATRAALAQDALEVRMEEMLTKVKLSWEQLNSHRGRDLRDQKLAFLSAVDDLSHLQKQSISLWKARCSQREKVWAAQVLQGWMRKLRTTRLHDRPLPGGLGADRHGHSLPIPSSSAITIQTWWRMLVAKRNYDHFSCVANLLPRRTRDIMRSKIQGPNLWGSLTRSRLKNQRRLL